ncbi:YkgJ family cysteine cluster protein [Synechococcus sp. PCC 6717]|jgi:Fe-S-cluster containining protein|uniref:Zinc/iron-chelating domain-containing protein n=1 Tax=Parathermosynechococcus lividus PCC 6715 TaxID=1917166 RepID=A0A2D2Q3Z0_PARLV|nr:YkgJ family cysteine cluster protein [Thermostichus lividus]ATS19212.1 zinc/iron-chelating domain-containing protein [Thermostichus lividus PCC 6715]MCH9055324.1 YkgJ family cysteine cluster protein [Synechococcus sp. PCC 6716]MCI3280753.1 YkgJ family cysteine cluster protein [Synechococcus sp. PCC 6717]
MATWQCMQGCGACCYLDLSDRPEVATILDEAEFALYQSLIGEDGWCIHFEPITRRCQIYAERPRFCRVTPEVFADLYGITAEELDEFAIACCREHISDRYGERSLELLRYEYALTQSLADS